MYDGPGQGSGQPVPPREVLDYEALDLSANGAIAGELFGRLIAERDRAKPSISLTDGADGTPAGITPQMSAWFMIHAAPRRNAALSAVRRAFATDRLREVPTILVEYETDKILNTTAADKNRVMTEFYRKTVEVRREADKARNEYEAALFEQGGRAPRAFRPSTYIIGLLAIAVSEFFLNYSSFRKVPFIDSPFLALSATALVAAALTWASHLHGSLLRQWDYYFGPHDRVRRYKGRQLIAIGSTLLTIALTAVVGARYYYVLPQIAEAILLGRTPPNLAGMLVFMALGNVLVYLVGAVWAYYTHDEIPDYASKKRRADAMERAFGAAFQGEVIDELDRLDRKAQADMVKINNRDTSQSLAPYYQFNRQLFARVQGKDDEVMALLREYRARLAMMCNDTIIFVAPDRVQNSQDKTRPIKASEWAARDLSLRFHTLATE